MDTSLRVVMSVHMGLNSMALLQWGTEEQKQKFLTPQAKGEKYAMFGLTEPGVGSDVAAMASTARREGDEYVVNGEKMWISLATRAHHILWVARTNPERPDPHDQLSAFIVETDRPGVTRGDLHGKLGVRAGSTGWVNCADVRVPAANRLGEEGEGFRIAMRTLEQTRPTIGAQAVGIAQAALDAALAYARERRAFDQPIGAFQGIQFMLADMATAVHAARLTVHHVAALMDRGAPSTAVEASMAKCLASDTAMRVTTEAVQIFGGYGYTREFPVERFMRDAKITQIYEGTNQIQRVVIARALLGL
jgi:alkylation response protein AidB-like acyl-CoA dehydrogenase